MSEKIFTLVVTLPYLWKTWGECLSISGENCGLFGARKFIRETARQLRIDPEMKCRYRWRDRFIPTCEVKDHPCVGRPRVTTARQARTCTGFQNCNFSKATQSRSNVQNFVISHSFFTNKVSN